MSKSRAEGLIKDIARMLDFSGDLSSTIPEFQKNCKQKGVGYSSYRDINKSVSSLLGEILSNPVLDEQKTCLAAIEIWQVASEYGWDCYPSTLYSKILDLEHFNGSILKIADRIKEFHYEEGQKTMTEKTETPKKTIKTRAITATKKAAKKAIVRKVTRRLSKNVAEIAVAQLAGNPQLQALFAGPVGNAVSSAVLAVMFEFIPLPEGVKEHFEPFKDALVEEFAVRAFDQGTEPIENLVMALMPSMKEMIPLLASGAAEMKQLAETASVD